MLKRTGKRVGGTISIFISFRCSASLRETTGWGFLMRRCSSCWFVYLLHSLSLSLSLSRSFSPLVIFVIPRTTSGLSRFAFGLLLISHFFPSICSVHPVSSSCLSSAISFSLLLSSRQRFKWPVPRYLSESDVNSTWYIIDLYHLTNFLPSVAVTQSHVYSNGVNLYGEKFLCHHSKISFATRLSVAIATRTVNIARKLY